MVGVWMEDAVLDALRYIDRFSPSADIGDIDYDDSADGDRAGGDFGAPPPPFPSVSSQSV